MPLIKHSCRHFVPVRTRLKITLFSSTTGGIFVGLSSMAGTRPVEEPGFAPLPESNTVGPMEGVKSDMETKLAFGAMKKWAWLAEKSPGFAVRGENVRVITCPNIFYQTLVEKVTAAKERISLASLYLGNGSMEEHLVCIETH